MDKKLKELINLDYFEIPSKKLKSKVLSFKFHMNDFKLSSDEPEIFVCNKTSVYDKLFVTNCIENDFVFLKDEIIDKLYLGSFSKDERMRFFTSISQIREAKISLAIFPERHQTIFGEFANIPQKITDIILTLGFEKVVFVNLIGTYFIKPIWLNKEQNVDARIESKFSIPITDNMDKIYFNQTFNKYMPSSASTYSHKIPIYARGNHFAEYFETIFSVCPNCKSFFTLKSEYSCVKCTACESAFEFSENYEINLTRNFSNLDEAKQFQKDTLSSIAPTESSIVSYKKLILKVYVNDKTPEPFNSSLDIFQNKFIYNFLDNSIEIGYNQILDLYLDYENHLHLTFFNNKNQIVHIAFQGKNKENLYLLIELYNIFKRK